MKLTSVLLIGVVGLSLSATEVAEVAKKMLPQVKENTITYRADNGWFYSKNELQHLSAGPLINGQVVKVSKATKGKNADPIPAIVNFNDQLKALGIHLIVVPVPPKLAVYPIAGLKVGEAAKYVQDFDKELIAKGVDVLDLTPDLIAMRKQGVFCHTDSHWSPTGIVLAAGKLAAKIGLKGNSQFTATEKDIKIAGDLQVSSDRNAQPDEVVRIRVIKGKVFADYSPVLLLGDSHTLVFSAGADMLAKDAGLAEQLAYELQLPIDRIAVKGSASTSARVSLYRKVIKKPEWLKNKKFVVWVFTCREFTESTNGWAKVPVQRK